MKTRCIILTALLSVLCVSALSAQVHTGPTWVSPCTLDVVLVTFDDATTQAGSYDYHEHDLPYGYTRQGVPTSSSYTLREFERLFSGGYGSLRDSAFVGNTVKVAKGNHLLPEVFGSVRAYYDSISTNPNARPDSGPPGVFQLHVRMINPADSQGYPRWVVLPQTKARYAEINENDQRRGNLFWDDAQQVGQDSVDRWYPNTDAYDLPNSTYDTERRLRHKVLYLYSGATYSARSPIGLLHPQADKITSPGARRIDSADLVGYRYVMGERQGWGNNDHSVDEFAGIGMHVHEIGHLLGFYHPNGEWGCSRPGLLASSCPDEAIRTNLYTNQHSSQVIITPTSDGGTRRDTVRFLAANLSGWGSMQSGAHGPERVGDGGYTSEYRSCPNPFNPFYRMELGWNARVNITTTTLNQRIEPGPEYFYVVAGANGQQYILDFRTIEEGFGQYTGWYRFTQSPGLLIWRRSTHFGRFNNTLLIPADGRSIFDARRRLVQAEPTSANSSYTYVWQDRLSDPFGAVEQNGPFGLLPGRTHRPSVTEATDATHLRYALGNNVPRPSRLAFRNIRVHRGASGGDYAEVDIYHNYWAGELDRNTTWRGTVYVGGDVTIPASTTLTIERGTQIRFLADTDDTGSGRTRTRSELIVEGELTVEAESDASDGGVTFRSANTVDPSNADWYGIRVREGGTATLSDAIIRDGSRCVQNEGGTLTMTNTTLTNCGATVTLDPIVPYPYVGQEAIQTTLIPAATDVEWQWQRRQRSTDGWTDIASATLATYTPTTDDVGSQLRAMVRYQAETNVYPYAQSAATMPVAAGLISVSFGSDSYQAFEGGAAALVMVQLSPSPSRSVSIPVVVSADEGTEPGDYTVAGLNEGEVVFAAGDSLESFTITANEDADRDDERVRLSFETSGVASASPEATVTLLDNDEADGTVALSSLSPQEGAQLTAEWTGPSGITNPRWQWQRQSGPTSWINVAGVSSQPQPWVSIYIPQAGDVGYPLRATVRYTDGGGSNQRAESATTAAVRAATVEPEGPPLFSSDRVSYSVPAGSTDQQILPAAERAESYATVGTLPGYVAVNTTTRAITIRPENTHVGDAEFIWRARNPRGTDDLTVNITVTPLVETEYAYRASQTAPLFDASASGVPDHWSSGAITWTDAAPRVWRIGRTRPSGGSWSGWGPLKKYSERPAAAAIFYQRARRAPAPPATQTGITLAVPSDWQTTPPPATDTQGVWTTTANRAQGAIPWLFTTPTQQTPPKIVQAPDPPRHFTAATGSPLTPGSIDLDWDSPTSGGTPTGYRVEYRFASGSWLLGATPTLTNASLVLSRAGALYQFRVRAENSVGNSGWVEATGTTSQSVPTETAYRLHTSGTTAPSFTASASGVPSGWSSSRRTPNPHARYEWEISRTRPTGGAWSSWGSATVVSTYTERRTAYRLHTSGTTAPSFTASASGVPSGWSSSRPTPNPHARYEWEISRTRPTGGAWSSWGSATVVSTYTERRTAYRLHTSGTTAPSFTASASGVPSGWSSSRQTPNPHARYEWEISRTRPTGGAWSSWGSATVVSTYTERRTAYRLHTSGTTAPSFTASASGVPSGWSSSRRTPNPHARYEWEISRTRPTGGAWSSWGSATVVSTYTERRTAYRLHTSGTTAPSFTASASGVPSGWSSSRQTPNPHARYEWQISRSRPTGGAWSSWGSASVVSRYTERQTAYKRNDSGTTAPAFSSTASGTPYGWSSSQPSPTSSNRYVWQISRSRPAGGSWSSWGSASVVSRYTERQTAYKRNDSSTTAPAFSSTASGTPYGWSSSPPSPTSSNRYVWRISRTRPTGGSWSSWGSATVISTYTERQTAFRLHTSGTTAPSFSVRASGVPSGWSSSRQTPNPHARYEWKISRTRPTGGSWSSWGSATVVSTYTERQTAFRLHTSGTTAPSFSASASGVPSGWSSSRPTPNPHERYEWQISRTRPTGGSWSNWGSATVVSTYTARQTTYQWNTSGTTFPAATSGTDAESPIKVQRRLAIAPEALSAPSAASGFGIGTMAGCIGMPARRPKSAS